MSVFLCGSSSKRSIDTGGISVENKFFDAVKTRRTHYGLSKEKIVSEEKVFCKRHGTASYTAYCSASATNCRDTGKLQRKPESPLLDMVGPKRKCVKRFVVKSSVGKFQCSVTAVA